MKEGDVLRSCRQWLEAHGLQPLRNQTGQFKRTKFDKYNRERHYWIRAGRLGSGDITVCGAGGRWIEIECKGPGGKQSAAQKERQKHVDAMGGLYILARSADDLEAWKEQIVGQA